MLKRANGQFTTVLISVTQMYLCFLADTKPAFKNSIPCPQNGLGQSLS